MPDQKTGRLAQRLACRLLGHAWLTLKKVRGELKYNQKCKRCDALQTRPMTRKEIAGYDTRVRYASNAKTAAFRRQRALEQAKDRRKPIKDNNVVTSIDR